MVYQLRLLPYNCSILFAAYALARQTRFCGNPAFVETMFFSSMSFVERWQRFAVVKQLGRALEGWERIALAIRFWSSCSIFGCGTYASGWERHTYALLTEKWGAHSKSLRSSRRGQIFQVWRKFAARTCHKAYWKNLERIICSQQACLFALVSRPASIPWRPGIP
jgi:hypothetical protein